MKGGEESYFYLRGYRKHIVDFWNYLQVHCSKRVLRDRLKNLGLYPKIIYMYLLPWINRVLSVSDEGASAHTHTRLKHVVVYLSWRGWINLCHCPFLHSRNIRLGVVIAIYIIIIFCNRLLITKEHFYNFYTGCLLMCNGRRSKTTTNVC